jgi:hypothetical protein
MNQNKPYSSKCQLGFDSSRSCFCHVGVYDPFLHSFSSLEKTQVRFPSLQLFHQPFFPIQTAFLQPTSRLQSYSFSTTSTEKRYTTPKLIYELERAQDAITSKKHHITYFRLRKCIFNLYFLIILLFMAL